MLKKVLYPPLYVVILSALSFPGVGWVLATGETGWFVYPIYVLSAYALVVCCLRLYQSIRRIPALRRNSRKPEERLRRLQWTLRKDLTLNLGSGAFYILTGFLENSAWVVTNGIYNLIQGGAYLILALYRRKLAGNYRERTAWQAYTAVGWWLLGVNLTMTGCVFLVIWRGESESYPGLLVFAVAALTFYKLISSIIRLVSLRKNNSPVQGAACNAKHTEAMMSLFLLQTALFSAFGQDFAQQKLMNTLTGTGVCLLTVLGAGGMILHGHKKIKTIGVS